MDSAPISDLYRAYIDCLNRQDWVTTVIWTRKLQALALDRGFFLHRSFPLNKVNVVSTAMVFALRDTRRLIAEDDFSLTDGNRSIEHLRRLEFREATSGWFYRQVFRFIDQQDRHGYSNTWEKECDLANSQLRWYRQMRGAPKHSSTKRAQKIRDQLKVLRNPPVPIHVRRAAALARRAITDDPTA